MSSRPQQQQRGRARRRTSGGEDPPHSKDHANDPTESETSCSNSESLFSRVNNSSNNDISTSNSNSNNNARQGPVDMDEFSHDDDDDDDDDEDEDWNLPPPTSSPGHNDSDPHPHLQEHTGSATTSSDDPLLPSFKDQVRGEPNVRVQYYRADRRTSDDEATARRTAAQFRRSSRSEEEEAAAQQEKLATAGAAPDRRMSSGVYDVLATSGGRNSKRHSNSGSGKSLDYKDQVESRLADDPDSGTTTLLRNAKEEFRNYRGAAMMTSQNSSGSGNTHPHRVSTQGDSDHHQHRVSHRSNPGSSSQQSDSSIVFADARILPESILEVDDPAFQISRADQNRQSSNRSNEDVWTLPPDVPIQPLPMVTTGSSSQQQQGQSRRISDMTGGDDLPGDTGGGGPPADDVESNDRDRKSGGGGGASSSGGGTSLKSLLVPETERGRWICRFVLLAIVAAVVGLVVYVVLLSPGDDGEKEISSVDNPNPNAPTAPTAPSATPAPAPFPDVATTPPVATAPGGTVTEAPVAGTATATEAPVSTDAQALVTYINSITLTASSPEGDELQYPPPDAQPTNEELALQFLIEEDAFVQTVAGSVLDQSSLRLLQRYALAVFYFATGGPEWIVPWDLTATVDECTLFGVQCVAAPTDAGTVIDVVAILDLNPDGRTGNNLQGTLPVDVALLEYLQGVDVSVNPGLTGTIPPEYTAAETNWVMLRNWISSSTGLSGPLPNDIGNWTAMEQFWIDGCDHTGTLPESIGSWTALLVFAIGENSFTGSLPSTIGAWTALTSFGVYDNQLTGSFPESIGDWTSMETFYAYENNFSGSLPESIGAWSQMTRFLAYTNQLSGPLPETIGNWSPAMVNFLVNGNELTGTLPASIGNWVGLTDFGAGIVAELSDFTYSNNLEGQLPDTIGNWVNLTSFDISGNGFAGPLPSTIASWSSLTYFAVNGNELTGGLDVLEEFDNAKFVFCYNNSFTGPLPDGIAVYKDIERFNVRGNQLTGTIPALIGVLEGSWSTLESGFFYDNLFEGSMPEGLCESATNLKELEADCEVECSCCTDRGKCDEAS